MNALLKSCPFCGATGDDLTLMTDIEGFGAGSAVVCDCCGAVGPSHTAPGEAHALWNGAALSVLELASLPAGNNQAGEVRPC